MSQLTVLNESQTQQVSGGHFGLLLALELPHIFMGFREFFNYFTDLYYNGCQNIEEDDHFTRLFCSK